MNDTPDLLFASAHSRDKAPGKIGGCVGTFLQLFDWNPRKRLFSTKRLPAERPSPPRKSPPAAAKKKYKDERMPVAKLLLLAEEENRGGFPSPKKVSSASSTDRISEDGNTGKRVPGVVARLMGLESLPDERVNEGKQTTQHPNLSPSVEVRPLQELLHTRQESVVLSELLREREATKLSLKDRLHVPVPGFVKKFPDPVPQMNYAPPKDGFKKSVRGEQPHLQPYCDQKYHPKSLRPLKKTSRDLSDSKHLILALSPRAGGDGLRPILLPSKVHNKLISSPIKSPTKMGSRSARLLEAAVKILEPSLQSNTARSRTPVRPSSASVREFKDPERDSGILESERREKAGLAEKKVVPPSNAARALKGQSMSRSWNGRDEAGKYNTHDSKNFTSIHEPGKRRADLQQQQNQVAHTRTASPLRNSQRSRGSRGLGHQEDMGMRAMEEAKTVVPQGFEEAYGGGLRPLNVGRREEPRFEKYEVEDRRVLVEKHVVSSLPSQSVSVSVVNSPYSECSERSTTSSYQDSLRRSGSAKEGLAPPTAPSSRSRFMRSKSVKEEKSSKLSAGGGGGAGCAQVSHHSRPPAPAREVRVKQEIPQQAHQQAYHGYQKAQQPHQVHQVHQQLQEEMPSVPAAPVVDGSPSRSSVEPTPAERDLFQEAASLQSTASPIENTADAEEEDDPKLPTVELPRAASSPEVEVSADVESVSSRASFISTFSQASSVATSKDTHTPSRSSSGGLLSYSRLFGARNKAGERKGDSKESKKKVRAEAPRKTESSLVRSLLRRKPSPQPNAASAPTLLAMEKPKKRGGKKVSVSEPASTEHSDVEGPGYLSEGYSVEAGRDIGAAVAEVKISGQSEECILHTDGDLPTESTSKCVNDVFPEVPLDKGCLRLLDVLDETGSKRRVIEGFDCVEDDSQERLRDGILCYAAQLMDDLKLEEMFSTGTVIQGSGRNGFSYSPLVELEEPRTSLESFILDDGGAEVEKCVSFLGRTGGSSSPEMSFVERELLAQEEEAADQQQQEKPMLEQRSRTMLELASEVDVELIEDAKASLISELSEARKIVDDALEEATERVTKRFANIGRVVLGDVDGSEAVCASVGSEDCGQPSPVSVLDCPFEEDETRSSQGNVHESISEMEDEYDEEDALMDDLLYKSATATIQPRKQRKARTKASLIVSDTDGSGKTETEKIVDAILDISRIRCIDPSECGLVLQDSESFQEEEEEYVRKILSVWETNPETSGNASPGAELPITSTLFDRIESQGRAAAWKREKEREEFGSPSPEVGPPTRSFKQWQGLWLHRRLLFDCVNETLAYRLKFKYPDPWMGIPVLRPQPRGRVLATDVYSEIKGLREVQVEELDSIIEMDMGRGFGNWCNLNQEIGEIGLEIERSILRGMIEELVGEILQVTNKILPSCARLI